MLSVKKDFPIFDNISPYGKPLTYLDNAASSQKPYQVLEAIDFAYRNDYANVHRGLHFLANQATEKFEKARITVQNFLGAQYASEIIWTSGATESINLAAHCLRNIIQAGDEIILSIAEHHANIVPWHYLREQCGAVIKWINLLPDGSLDMAHYKSLLSDKTKIVAITHMSNILGTVNDVAEIAAHAHQHNAYILVDGSQAAVHFPVNVQQLDVDFYAITGHKLYAPTGIGALYIKNSIAQSLPPFQGGGEMIDIVTKDTVTYNVPPHRFEAGTPQIIQAIGLAAGIEYMQAIGFEAIMKHERLLTDYMFQKFAAMPQVTLLLRPSRGCNSGWSSLRASAYAIFKRILYGAYVLCSLQYTRRY